MIFLFPRWNILVPWGVMVPFTLRSFWAKIVCKMLWTSRFFFGTRLIFCSPLVTQTFGSDSTVVFFFPRFEHKEKAMLPVLPKWFYNIAGSRFEWSFLNNTSFWGASKHVALRIQPIPIAKDFFGVPTPFHHLCIYTTMLARDHKKLWTNQDFMVHVMSTGMLKRM